MDPSDEKLDKNNTNFPLWNYERLKGKKWTSKDLELYHQFLVRQYVIGTPSVRGVLAFHGTGYGKTRLGANNIKEYVKDRQIVVIAPKSVFSKFLDEFRTVGVDATDVHFIALKAGNLSAQIDRLEPEGSDIDLLRKTPLDNTFLIVDEAHNFFNAIVNGSKNAVDLYDNIMSAKNLKILFLSGSPVINDPFELVTCFNMLHGSRLFPESKIDFDKYFISDDGLHVKNADKFKNRIFGYVSYFGDWVQASQRADRPKRLPTEIIKVPMSDEQYAIYSGYRDKEREEKGTVSSTQTVQAANLKVKIKMPQETGDRFSQKSSSSSYRIKSRQASNLVPIKGATDKDITNPKHCPKFHRAYQIIEHYPDSPGMTYSNFVHDAGLEDFARLLDAKGWERWDGEDEPPSGKGRRYAIISGDQDIKVRERIQKVASGIDNIHGKVVRQVLVGPAGAEGIEFLNFRYNIIMDPFFNAVRSEQAENRIDRHKSHVMLPPKERTVQTYYLLSVYPKDAKPADIIEPTTDEHLYIQSKRRKLLSLEFYRLLIEASMDCPIHRDALPKARASQIKCLMCAPTNMPMFTDRLDKDINTSNPCRPPQVESLKAKEIIIDMPGGEKRKYMYSREKDGTSHFFEYQEDLGGYISVARNDPNYDLLVESLS